MEIPHFKKPEPDSLFLASKYGLRTFADLEKYKKFFLQFLLDFELDPTEPVGFLAESSDELVFSIASCWLLGIPFICYSPKATDEELSRQINRFKPSAIIVDEDHMNSVPEELKLNIKQLNLQRCLELDHELSPRALNYEPGLSPGQVFGYFFTSGTTGEPKTVPLKRRQMLYAADASANNFRPRSNHFWLLCLPLNHIGGISIIIRSLLYGSGIYRMHTFDVQMTSTFLSENKLFQAASLVPTMLKRLLEIPAFQTHSNFRAILLGGGPIDPSLLQQSIDKGIPLVPSYGMTETCAQIAANPILKPSGIYGPLRSAGTLFKPNQLEIRDDNGEKLGINNSGLIWLKGPQVFDGYLDDEYNREAFDADDWFNTGDYGHLNANGQLFIESRRSDLIITGGENVSPYEVESELEKIDPITEAAVFGIPDSEWGQKVVAVVVSKTELSIETDEILNKLRERMTPFKVPKEIIQANSIPRTDSGKVHRSKLAEYFNREKSA